MFVWVFTWNRNAGNLDLCLGKIRSSSYTFFEICKTNKNRRLDARFGVFHIDQKKMKSDIFAKTRSLK